MFSSLLVPEINNIQNLRFKHKHLWVKKSTGLGITEFMLRLMAWLCTSTDDRRFKNSQTCIITGPNIEMAIKLIKRLKQIFEPKLGLYFSNKETVLELNGCSIEAYPSNHIDSFWSLDDPKFILLDEADFFRKGEQEEVRHVSERYIGKSDPYIVMVSTTKNQDLKKCYHFPLVPWATNEITHEQIQGLYLTVKTPKKEYCTLLINYLLSRVVRQYILGLILYLILYLNLYLIGFFQIRSLNFFVQYYIDKF